MRRLLSPAKGGGKMGSDEEIKFAFSSLDDDRKLISAGKVQRWEVTKWAVALNVGLASASALVSNKPPFASAVIVHLCALVAVLAGGACCARQ